MLRLGNRVSGVKTEFFLIKMSLRFGVCWGVGGILLGSRLECRIWVRVLRCRDCGVNFEVLVGIGETVGFGNIYFFFRIGPVGCGFCGLDFENRIFVRA